MRPAWKPAYLGAVAALSLLGAALRLPHLDTQELWLDETFQVRMATTERLGEALRLDYTPPLGYLLWRAWVGAFGESELAVRSLAAIFGILFVPAAIAAGRAILTPAAGLWAGALAATSPLHVYYSQEARVYSLLCLAILLAHQGLWWALATPRPAAFAAFAASAAVALMSHHYAGLALAPALLLAWRWPRDEWTTRRRRGFVAACAAAGLPWLAWVAWNWLVIGPVERHHWFAQVWRALPPALAIPKSLEALAFGPQAGSVPGFFKQFTILEFPTSLRALGILVLAALGAVALAPWRDARLALPGVGLRRVWLAAVVFFPLLALWSVSFWLPTYVAARYDMVAFPGLVLLLALGFAKLDRGALLAAPAFFAVVAVKLALYHSLPSFPAGSAPSRETATAIHHHVANGDLVVFTAYRGATVGYYLHRLGYREQAGTFEAPGGRRFALRRLATHPSSLGFDFDHPERARFDLEQTRLDLRGYLAQLDPERATVWVEVLPAEPPLPRFKAMLAEELARAGFRPGAPPPALAPGQIAPYRRGG